ncbi:YqxA family protein [Bacillus sp. AK128]
MIKFSFKFFLLFTILFLGVLLGMQQANEGIRDMKGYDDPEFKGAFHLTAGQSGGLEAAVLGNNITSHDIRVKQEKLEKMEAFNFFSSMGHKLADGITSLFQKLFDLI